MSREAVIGTTIGISGPGGYRDVRCIGIADALKGRRVSPMSQFAIGSVSKQFTAAAIIRLVEEGRLSFEDAISAHLQIPKRVARGVRIDHLLTHTAGLGELADPYMLEAASQNGCFTREAVLATLCNSFSVAEPGAMWFYSNTGYYLLGLIVEAVSGVHFGDYLHACILQPAGLKQTSPVEKSDYRVSGYLRAAGRLWDVTHPTLQQTFGSGGLWSTADDLLSWQIALHTDRVLGSCGLRRMTTATELASGMRVGYGAGLYTIPRDGSMEFSHHGAVGAFSSQLSYYPTLEVGFVVLTTGPSFEAERIAECMRLALFGIPSQQAKQGKQHDVPDDVYAGSYVFGSRRLIVRIHNERLQMTSPSGEIVQLDSLGDGEFALEGFPGMVAKFLVEGREVRTYQVSRYGRPLAVGQRA